MQFWGDMVLEDPSIIPNLPKNITVLEWGYESNHPFDHACSILAKDSLKFYVCPGTSSWNSIGGRTENAIKNLTNAAVNGFKQGAIGYLITDWGDNGHWQPLCVSYLGFAVGASLAWNVTSNFNSELYLQQLLDNYIFYDEAKVMGKIFYDLGNSYNMVGVPLPNGSWLARIFLQPDVVLQDSEITLEAMKKTLNHIDEAIAPIGRANMKRSDAALIIKEAKWIAEMLKYACNLYIARLESPDIDAPIHTLPIETRKKFKHSIRELSSQFKEIWVARNRSGGLSDSLNRFDIFRSAFNSPFKENKPKS